MKTELLSEVADDIKTGDLIAFRVEGVRSLVDIVLKGYQVITGAKYSHVGVAVRLGTRVFVVEATPPRVAITPLNTMGDFYLIPADVPGNEDSQIDYLLDFSKRKYSLLDMFTHYLGIDFSDKSLYCSELAGQFYRAFSFILDYRARHSPDKIAEAVKTAMGMKETRYIVADRGNLR